MFQSTRPRGARHDLDKNFKANVDVSIHAPAGGATLDSYWRIRNGSVSIHAPAGGATGDVKTSGC